MLFIFLGKNEEHDFKCVERVVFKFGGRKKESLEKSYNVLI